MKLTVGEKAPDFQGKDQDGKEVRLADYAGNKLVLYFYPNDDTEGCTIQACNLRDNYHRLLRDGYEVLGVSANDEESHRKFIGKYNLPFPLLADTNKSINELYGVWVEKNNFGHTYMGTKRTTFVINEQGIIEDIIEDVDKENHASQILKEKETSMAGPETTYTMENTALETEKPAVKKKAAPKKATAKKPAAKKTAKKKVVKKAAKKVAPKKKTVKKAAAKKSVKKVKKAAPKKAAKKVVKKAAKKTAPKKKVAKKTTTKKKK